MDEANATPFGRYRLVALLGRGGMVRCGGRMTPLRSDDEPQAQGAFVAWLLHAQRSAALITTSELLGSEWKST
jgi:hypothetical protein